MKALLIYSHHTGRKNFGKEFDYVKAQLSGVFDELSAFCSLSKEESFRKCQEAAGIYDVIIAVGGDGTFNNLLNAIMPLDKKPILGYLNFGTLGDVGRVFGLSGKVKKDVEIIKQGFAKDFDVGKLTKGDKNYYFSYVACTGAYSDIPYTAKRRDKKRIGRIAYYLMSIRRLFKKELYHYRIEFPDGTVVERESPFLLFMNGTHMAGFNINRNCLHDDGFFETYVTKSGLFNGLLHYIPFQTQKPRLISRCLISESNSGAWCLDGEKGPDGPVGFEVCHKAVRIIAKKR